MHADWTTRGMWLDDRAVADRRLEFEGQLSLASATKVTLGVFASAEYRLWVDGRLFGEGPCRFASPRPEFSEFVLDLTAGEHAIRILADELDLETRMNPRRAPFLASAAHADWSEVAIRWRVRERLGARRAFRRINPQLGWIDWWNQPESFGEWREPVSVPTLPNSPRRCEIAIPIRPVVEMRRIGAGKLTQRFGYANDDPPAAFALRDLRPRDPAQGEWRRFDLGRVRLGRPELTLDLPRGAIVEVAMAESLTDGRVVPWLTLSTGPSCNLDRFVARGGVQSFTPSAPKGGRFVEVHVIGERVGWRETAFRERAYHGEPEGSFQSSDPLLDRVWRVGVESYRACAEDAIIDNPTRERGQWMGDALTVGLEVAACAYSDLGLVKRGIRQAAEGARDDGLVMGLGPGTVGYLSSYALHWMTAVLRYYEITGDVDFLREALAPARRNARLFMDRATQRGVGDVGAWGFVDWGYEGGKGGTDHAMNLFAYAGFAALVGIERIVGDVTPAHEAFLRSLAETVGRRAPGRFHFEALALACGLPGDADVVERHYRSAFPNDASAPRLADPSYAGPRLITPFFSHWALEGLWRAGRGDFALDQYRRAWGWALDQGLTTWPEVFDLRWSHCHQWSACPTWQLTRHVLGARWRDRGARVLDMRPSKCSVRFAEGRLPGPEGVRVRRDGSRMVVESETPVQVNDRAPARRHEFSA